MRGYLTGWAALMEALVLVALLVGVGLRSIGGTYAVFTDADAVSGSLSAAASFGPIPATVDIDPDTLYPNSQGNFVMAYIELPAGFDVADIDVGTVILRVAGIVGPGCSEPNDSFVAAELRPTEVGDHDGNGIDDLMVKFKRPDVLPLITGKAVDGLVTLVVSGQLLSSGTTFEGCDTIDPPEVATPKPEPTPEPPAAPEPTPTPEATATPTATGTPAATPTVTGTPTPSATPAATASVTPTASLSATATFTPSASSTPTATATLTATPSATPTATRTATPSLTPTATATAITTPTPGTSATAMPSPTAVAASTATRTTTPTPRLTRTPTPTPTVTAP